MTKEIKCFVCGKDLGEKRKEKEGTIQTGDVSLCSDRCYQIYINQERKKDTRRKEISCLSKQINELVIVKNKLKENDK